MSRTPRDGVSLPCPCCFWSCKSLGLRLKAAGMNTACPLPIPPRCLLKGRFCLPWLSVSMAIHTTAVGASTWDVPGKSKDRSLLPASGMDRPAGREREDGSSGARTAEGVTTVTIHVYPRQNLDAQRARSVWSSRNAAEDEHKVSLGLWPCAEPSRAGQGRGLQEGRLQVLQTGSSLLKLRKKSLCRRFDGQTWHKRPSAEPCWGKCKRPGCLQRPPQRWEAREVFQGLSHKIKLYQENKPQLQKPYFTPLYPAVLLP